ncbi:MAG TPA: Ig-like domain repeat protein, partial [Gaiellaceae bacterium]
MLSALAGGSASAAGTPVTLGFTGGAQTWTVPSNVTSVSIQAIGAAGGSLQGDPGGAGASITGTFVVTPGQVLTILVGGQGTVQFPGSTQNAGGGGGSFVWKGTGAASASSLLVAAGGGGGGGDGNAGVNASTSTSGTASPGGTPGGANGSGGSGGSAGYYAAGGGGGGLLTSGGDGAQGTGGYPNGGGGKAISIGGGAGSGGIYLEDGGSAGGYGGGGGGGMAAAGGGGGYSGGGGGSSTSASDGGGGGGSFNGGTSQSSRAGASSGNGSVVITPLTFLATPTTPTISNLPVSGAIGGSFVASVSTNGDGAKSVSGSGACTVGSDGLTVSFVGKGTCSLVARVAAGSQFASADGTTQSFPVSGHPTSLTASASPTSTTYGHAVTLTASGLPSTATGTVTFTASGTLCTATVSGGSGSCSTSSTLDAGTIAVTATYSGDALYEGSTAGTSFTLTQAAPASPTITNLPPSAIYSQGFTAAVATNGDGAKSVVTSTASVCTVGTDGVTVSDVGVGTCTLTAHVDAGADYAAADGSPQSYAVAKAPTSLTASAAPPTAGYGTAVTLSSGGLAAGATGTVTFSAGGTTLCTGSAAGGTASCATSTVLATGAYAVTASYAGDDHYLASEIPTHFTITPAPTSLSASASPSSTSYGDAVQLSANGLPPAATGTVTFSANDATLCTSSVSGGSAACSTATSLQIGTYDVSASYSGDNDFAQSLATTAFAIDKIPTSFTAAANPPETSFGGTVQLSATGFPSAATGIVTFSSGGSTLCIALVSGGGGSCPTGPGLNVATYDVTARYAGDSLYAASSSTTQFTIGEIATSISAAATPSTTAYGNTIELVGNGLPTEATGTIVFSSDGSTLCSAPVSGGSASCATGALHA